MNNLRCGKYWILLLYNINYGSSMRFCKIWIIEWSMAWQSMGIGWAIDGDPWCVNRRRFLFHLWIIGNHDTYLKNQTEIAWFRSVKSKHFLRSVPKLAIFTTCHYNKMASKAGWIKKTFPPYLLRIPILKASKNNTYCLFGSTSCWYFWQQRHSYAHYYFETCASHIWIFLSEKFPRPCCSWQFYRVNKNVPKLRFSGWIFAAFVSKKPLMLLIFW